MIYPAWISSLKDPVLKADFEAYWTTFVTTGGAISENDMLRALQGLAKENAGKANSALSAPQVADLQSIASNIGSTNPPHSMNASPYLQFITNALVNGNPANATFTGGAATSVPLGNLKAGYSLKHLDDLIGKWFLGDDLPSDVVEFYNTPENATPYWSEIGITYSSVNAPLYNPNTNMPSILDVNQGYLGDCYLMAPLAEIAQQDPLAIKSMITDNGNGAYGVRFYVDGTARYVTVNNELANGGSIFNSSSYIWASIIESAYAQIQDQGNITGLNYNFGNSYSTIGNGGMYIGGLEVVTDASQITSFSANGTNWAVNEYNRALNVTGSQTEGSATALSAVVADLCVGNDVTLGSSTDDYLAADPNVQTLVAGHDFSVVGYDASSGMLELRNPWGSNAGTGAVTNFEVSINSLLADDDFLAADNVGTASWVDFAPAVAAEGLQAMSQITNFTVRDSAANIQANLRELIAAPKLQEVFVDNPGGGAASLNLTGLNAGATVDLGLDFAQATLVQGLIPFVSLGTGFDSITLGSGTATIDFWQDSTTESVACVQNFNSARDALSFQLNGGPLNQEIAFDGSSFGDYIYATNSRQGVFLAGVTSVQHSTVSSGFATVT